MKVGYLTKQFRIGRVLTLPVLLCVFPILGLGCEPTELEPKEGAMELTVSSPVFQQAERIPTKYTCEGQDVSPPLTWSEPPPGTQSLALIMDDPDAPGGVFTHWVIFSIPSDSRSFPEALPTQAELPTHALQGKNGFSRIGYGGPCPPAGRPHHYQFTLYAVDQVLNLKAGVSKKQLLDAIEGHILAQGTLTGTYQR